MTRVSNAYLTYDVTFTSAQCVGVYTRRRIPLYIVVKNMYDNIITEYLGHSVYVASAKVDKLMKIDNCDKFSWFH